MPQLSSANGKTSCTSFLSTLSNHRDGELSGPTGHERRATMPRGPIVHITKHARASGPRRSLGDFTPIPDGGGFYAMLRILDLCMFVCSKVSTGWITAPDGLLLVFPCILSENPNKWG